jgi:phage gpG-like protein
MKLKISVGVDFGKLANEMPKLIDEALTAYAEDTEQGSKDKIDRGVRPKLENSTKEIRKKSGYRVTPPLKASGNLYNSIKSNEKGLEILKYGTFHQSGFITSPKSMIPNKVVPARPFIEPTKNGFKKILDNFYKKSKEKLRRKTPLVLET